MSNENALIPYSEIRLMASDIHKSGMFKLQTPEAAMALMMLSQAEGMHPVMALRRYHVLADGRTSMRADAMAAGFRAIGGIIEWLTEADDGKIQRAKWTLGKISKEIGFTWAEAEKAGYTRTSGTNWHKDPASQLRARATSRAIRMLAPEIVVGLYTPEELEEVPRDEPGQAKPTKASRQAPDVQTATVIESTSGAPAQAAASAPEEVKATAANAADEEKDPKDEKGRLKFLRGKFNQAMLVVKTGNDFIAVRGEFEKTHGKDFMNKPTGFPRNETFMSLMQEHWNRIEPILRENDWRSKMQACETEADFRPLEDRFLTGDVPQSKENEDIVNAKGVSLKLSEYIGGMSSASHLADAQEEDLDAQANAAAERG